MELAGVGVWSSQLRYGDPAESADAAAELDELGFKALWIPDVGGQVFDAVGRLLTATRRTVIATGILNLWMHSAGDVAQSYAALTASVTLVLLVCAVHVQLDPTAAPARVRTIALRQRARQSAFLRLRDPNASGRARPRAPSARSAAA